MKDEGIDLKLVYMRNAPRAEVNDVAPIQKVYDFSFVRQAEQQLNKRIGSRDAGAVRF